MSPVMTTHNGSITGPYKGITDIALVTSNPVFSSPTLNINRLKNTLHSDIVFRLCQDAATILAES